MSVDQVVMLGSYPAPQLTDSHQVIPARLTAIHKKHVVVHPQGAKGLKLVLDEAAEARVRLVGPHIRHGQYAISLSHSSFRVAADYNIPSISSPCPLCLERLNTEVTDTLGVLRVEALW